MKRLKQYNRKNDDDDDDDVDDNDPLTPLPPSFNLPLYYPPLPSIDKGDNDIENNLNPIQKFLLGDTPQQEKVAVAVGEKTTTAVKKARFSGNLNKLFPKADEIFNDQKIDIDDDDLPKHEITTPNTQKYLFPTGLLKDSIQDSLDMIVTDGKFKDASVRRALNTKYP